MKPVLSSPKLEKSILYSDWCTSKGVDWFCSGSLERLFDITEGVKIRAHAYGKSPHQNAIEVEIAYDKEWGCLRWVCVDDPDSHYGEFMNVIECLLLKYTKKKPTTLFFEVELLN